MRYLCQVWVAEGAFADMSKADQSALNRDSLAYDEELERNGNLVHAEALQPPRTAATVRVRKGETMVTDGPFAETKEHLGGFILIEARDLNDAIRIAAGIPMARLGAIEVRPIFDIPVE